MFQPIPTKLPNSSLDPGGTTVKLNKLTTGQSFKPALMSE